MLSRSNIIEPQEYERIIELNENSGTTFVTPNSLEVNNKVNMICTHMNDNSENNIIQMPLSQVRIRDSSIQKIYHVSFYNKERCER